MIDHHPAKPERNGEASPAGEAPRDLILTCGLSPGDILMMTAAVRDLHLAYPGRFRTDVRTPAGAIWENNPYITRLDPSHPDVRTIPMRYDLIHRSNQGPHHFIHGYVQHLERELDVRIPVTQFRGDIHLSAREKAWLNQVAEEPISWHRDFWIIIAGGKYDFTAKWWDPARYQRVVDHFRGRIQFVQCGEAHHWHPRLDGVIDLVGRTDLRQFIRLMYHASGVVCPVTFPMHLAAAVEMKPGRPKNRACVVIAGGREPSQWEKYGHHRFLETNGALLCCDNGGCWKSRCQTVGDGDEKDSPENLCVLPVQVAPDLRIPRCLDLIGAEDVIRAIELYHRGGAYRYLDEVAEAFPARPITWSRPTIHTLRKAGPTPGHDLPPGTAFFTVTDAPFFPGTLATVNSILRFHPDAEVLVVDRTDDGLNEHQRRLLRRGGARVLDSERFRAEGRQIGPWELKAYAASDLAPRYRLLIGIDSDCVLCDGVADVAHRVLETGRFAGGRDGDGVTYDESYAPYGIQPGSRNPHYMSTSLYFCPTTPRNLEILERWASYTNQAEYNGRGRYAGYSDQGVLNGILFAQHGTEGTEMLDNHTWSQHWVYWDDILVVEGDRLLNRTWQNRRQRSLHCGGTEKFWDPSHRDRILTTNPHQSLNYALWLSMLWFGPCRDASIDPALYLPASALHLVHDLANFFGEIRRFSPDATLHPADGSGLLDRMLEGLPGSIEVPAEQDEVAQLLRGLPRGSRVAVVGPGGAATVARLALICMDLDFTFDWAGAISSSEEATYDGEHPALMRRAMAELRGRFPSLRINPVLGLLPSTLERSLDAAFIGGCPSEVEVRRQIACCRPAIKEGGLLLGDGWARDPVKRGVHSAFDPEDIAESQGGSVWIVRL